MILDIPKQSDWGSGLRCSNNKEVRYLLAHSAADWRIEGQPLVLADQNAVALNGDIYRQLVEGAEILPENLRSSFSGLCLAGRAQGETATQAAYGSIRFRIQEAEIALSEVLTIHSWSSGSTVSRVSFFNARTGQFDRYPFSPALVVADGDSSFLRVLMTKELERSDVIGVVPKTLDRERLEAVGGRMQALSQWYVEDVNLAEQLAEVPLGINSSFLRRKLA